MTEPGRDSPSQDKDKKHILLVEDEPHLAFNLQLNLEHEGFRVTHCDNGHQAVRSFMDASDIAVIVLDVMLPGLDGFAVAKEIRKTNGHVGILMLTARISSEDKVHGFEVGVDDYITKPFHLDELLLRIARMAKRAELLQPKSSLASQDDRAHLHTSLPQMNMQVEGGPQDRRLAHGPLHLDTESMQLTSPAGDRTLTLLEMQLMSTFMQNPDRPLSRGYLLEHVWGVRKDMETRTVDNFVGRLRRYIEEQPSKPQWLVSVRGRGYVLKSEGTSR